MTVISCKMCGGDMELLEDMTHGRCQYCGSIMTLPKIDDEQRASAFNRGNHFRRIGEFDKAVSVYERIVNENNADAEAHWCLALSRFGIEYVKDPVSGEYKPTCHRASYDSFLEDVDYQAALEYSDGVTRRQYEEDARKIMEVQKGLLAISRREEEFDIFICYKESDDSGNRTKDSVLAQDIYYQLTEQGYRVFFSRITLEDKAGMEYEPYIFAALHSARVMIVVGTKPEYLNAVWVKNEWSRYLAFMKQDKNKLILPCYRDMDPYDMPEQLSILQAYDMGKIGFVQDLLHGIGKVLKKDESEKVVLAQRELAGNQNALVKRGYMALEDREFERADDFFEQALNQNAECGEAYLGKKLALETCSNLDDYVKMQTEVTEEKWDLILKRNITDDPRWKQYMTDCISELKNKYTALDNITEKFQKIYDKKVWTRATAWEEHLQNVQREIDSDKLFKRAMQYGEPELQKMIKEQHENIISILGKKVKDEDEIMLGHLKWVESQIQLLEQSEKQNEERKKKIHIEFENKRKERMLLDEAFQEVINNGDLDKLKEYHSSYIELEIYFENVSDEYECYGRVLEEYEYSLCREKIEACEYALKFSSQCSESIERYRSFHERKKGQKIGEREWRELRDKFQTYLKQKKYLSKKNIELCEMYYEFCKQELQKLQIEEDKDIKKRTQKKYVIINTAIFIIILVLFVVVIGI